MHETTVKAIMCRFIFLEVKGCFPEIKTANSEFQQKQIIPAHIINFHEDSITQDQRTNLQKLLENIFTFPEIYYLCYF